ncbi:hypothetical protein EXIGLDRAFT_702517 [Exidia glandulosa HHB12029]|uniref:Uncharacterized protein n=1 Tax=Exidia glandulosa HHB12029 TaxID=1314781 RepID=A0A165LHR1_EXIGL|nr:hypothetical protein EXIGLDRAFT_702517 [Exidia glandulosa HHB12029]
MSAAVQNNALSESDRQRAALPQRRIFELSHCVHYICTARKQMYKLFTSLLQVSSQYSAPTPFYYVQVFLCLYCTGECFEWARLPGPMALLLLGATTTVSNEAVCVYYAPAKHPSPALVAESSENFTPRASVALAPCVNIALRRPEGTSSLSYALPRALGAGGIELDAGHDNARPAIDRLINFQLQQQDGSIIDQQLSRCYICKSGPHDQACHFQVSQAPVAMGLRGKACLGSDGGADSADLWLPALPDARPPNYCLASCNTAHGTPVQE